MFRLPTASRFLVGFVAVATFAGACGDDGTGAETSPTTVPEQTTTALTEEGALPEETLPDETLPDETLPEVTATAPVERTASFRGVSENAIKLGVVAADLESVRDLVDLDHGSYEAAYAAVIAEVNAGGGIHGREIEMVFDSFLPIGTQGMDTICARLTQDEQVFAVIGGLLDDGPLCYTALNETAFVGSTQNDRRVEASSAPWFTGTRNTDDVIDVVVRGFDREGVFEGATLAIVAAVADKAQVERTALPLLAELDVDVVDVAFIEASPIDTVAAEGEVQVIAEKQRSAGVDLVLAIGGGVAQYAGGLEDLTYRPRIAATSLSTLRVFIRDRSGRDFSVLTDAVAGNTAEQLGWWDDPAIQECVALVEATGEPTIFDPNTRAVDEPENLVSVAAACRDVALFVAIADAAGPELTNESFAAAGADLGAFHIPGFGDGFYDADTPDGGAPVFFYEWDETLEDLRSDGTIL